MRLRNVSRISKINSEGGDGQMSNEVEVETLHRFFHELDELIGQEAMLTFYQQYRGMQISVPSHLYDRKLCAQRIIAEYDGTNQQALARKYGYSQKWIQRILHSEKECHRL